MKALACTLVALGALAWLGRSRVQAAPLGTVTVDAGEFDRQGTPVLVALPAELAGKSLELRAGGARLPLQVGPGGEGRFVLARLGKGKRVRYTITEARTAAKPAAEATADAEGLWLSLGGKRVLFYRAKGVAPRPDVKPELVRGGYLHPVISPGGRTVTDDYPVDHKHHHGIWTAWTSTEYEGRKPDFWNMGSKTGRKDHVALADSFGGAVAAGFTARLSSTDLKATPPKVVLEETWKVVLFAGPSKATHHLFELEATDQLQGSSPLVLPEYLYGGLALRGPGAWNGEKNALFLTSEGKDRPAGENTTARWYFLGGEVEGKPAGIAVLGHPGNFRAPQPVRIHPKEPYFSVSPSKAGRWSMEPGKPYTSRYRFVAIDGKADKALFDRLWNDYAHPPTATVDLPRGS